MANTYHQVYIQAVFAVKYRESVIDKKWKFALHCVIAKLINETGCNAIIINGTEDHVHCFIGLKPTVAISELMKNVKAKSSKYVNDNQLTKNRFEWQEGYGVFSYSQSHSDAVCRYIANQEEHHQIQSFKDEHREFMDKFNISYDERFCFDEMV